MASQYSSKKHVRNGGACVASSSSASFRKASPPASMVIRSGCFIVPPVHRVGLSRWRRLIRIKSSAACTFAECRLRRVPKFSRQGCYTSWAPISAAWVWLAEARMLLTRLPLLISSTPLVKKCPYLLWANPIVRRTFGGDN